MKKTSFDAIQEKLFDTDRIDSIERLFELAGNYEFVSYSLAKEHGWRTFYRGQSRSSYGLRPAAFRQGRTIAVQVSNEVTNYDELNDVQKALLAELIILAKFYAECSDMGLPTPEVSEEGRSALHSVTDGSSLSADFLTSSLFDGLVPLTALAQHNGLPTTLLDWTQDFWVALYFALFDFDESSEEDCCVWVARENIDKFFTSKGNTSLYSADIEFIKSPKYRNVNLIAQKGLFSRIRVLNSSELEIEDMDLQSLVARNVMRVADGDALSAEKLKRAIQEDRLAQFVRIDISRKIVGDVRQVLAGKGITHSSLFPGYKSIAEGIVALFS